MLHKDWCAFLISFLAKKTEETQAHHILSHAALQKLREQQEGDAGPKGEFPKFRVLITDNYKQKGFSTWNYTLGENSVFLLPKRKPGEEQITNKDDFHNPFLKHRSIYLKTKVTETKRERDEAMLPFAGSLPRWPKLGQAEARSCIQTSGSKHSGHPPPSCQTISRELDWKWSSRDTNQCSCGMPALQGVALPTMPWHHSPSHNPLTHQWHF